VKRFSEYFLALSLAGILAAIHYFMGSRVFNFALGLAVVWFVISMVLLSRPPGIPEFVSDQSDPDEQQVTRKDVIPTLGILDRVRLSFSVAFGACLLLWMSLVLLAN
jgi:hypothetical protein